jgi:hypothetical protein
MDRSVLRLKLYRRATASTAVKQSDGEQDRHGKNLIGCPFRDLNPEYGPEILLSSYSSHHLVSRCGAEHVFPQLRISALGGCGNPQPGPAPGPP